MSVIASDAFSGAAGTELSTYSASWTPVTGTAGAIAISGGQRARREGTLLAAYRHTAAPPSADYVVSADMEVFAGTYDGAGVIARASASAFTCYMARHYNNGYGWQLFKYVAGALYQLGADVAQPVYSGQSHIALRVEGATISLYKSGEQTPAISQTDSAIGGAGYAGLYFRNGGAGNDGQGIHLDNWSVDTFGAASPTINSITASNITQTGARITLGLTR